MQRIDKEYYVTNDGNGYTLHLDLPTFRINSKEGKWKEGDQHILKIIVGHGSSFDSMIRLYFRDLVRREVSSDETKSLKEFIKTIELLKDKITNKFNL